jgi:hypothetical protein
MYSGQLGIPYARQSTTEWKLSNNPSAGGKMDFYVSGDMYKSMYLKPEQGGFYIEANVSYADKLQNDYPQMWIYSRETQLKLVQDIINNGFKDYLI